MSEVVYPMPEAGTAPLVEIKYMIVKLFKTFKLTWRQAALYESAMISLGIVLGTTWPGLARLNLLFWTIFLAFSAYVVHVWWKQVATKSKDNKVEL